MHVFEYLIDHVSDLFRFHRYCPFEKAYATILFISGPNLRDISERYCLTYASESVRRWVHRVGSLFRTERKHRRLVVVDETVKKIYGYRVYVWSAVDVDSGEKIAIYASIIR